MLESSSIPTFGVMPPRSRFYPTLDPEIILDYNPSPLLHDSADNRLVWRLSPRSRCSPSHADFTRNPPIIPKDEVETSSGRVVDVGKNTASGVEY